jgi:hypothetical protein
LRTRNGSDRPRNYGEKRLTAARFKYISSHFCPQKSRSITFFTSIGATFARAKFFSPDLAFLPRWLCYYRQRSLKNFFDALRLSEGIF